MTKIFSWFDVPRRTMHYDPAKATSKVQERFTERIKQFIEVDPSRGYRPVASLLQFNKSTVRRICRLQGWQVRKTAIGYRPRIDAAPSVGTTPNERWATDLCGVRAVRDDWQTLALGIYCHTRELVGLQLARSGRATAALWSIEQELIARFGTLGRLPAPFVLRLDNGLVFAFRVYTRLVCTGNSPTPVGGLPHHVLGMKTPLGRMLQRPGLCGKRWFITAA
jgi:putative transposase